MDGLQGVSGRKTGREASPSLDLPAPSVLTYHLLLLLRCEMPLVPFLEPIESRFDMKKVSPWLEENWTLSIYISAVYVALVFLGKQWMRDRPAYSLRRPLAMWNTGLMVFSVLGFLTLFPPLAHSVLQNGFLHSVCHDSLFSSPQTALWGTLFLFSKPLEFGDTFFIILRKTPLNFLHWYHHISVFIYSAYGITPFNALSNWFGAANLLVHSVMYSYYTLKATGFHIPRAVAQSVTVLQLVQFVLGLTVITSGLLQKNSGVECEGIYRLFYAGVALYMSYLVLFLNFFYQRYVRRIKN